MAITHSTAARNASADAVLALLNVGGAGNLVFLTGAAAEVATLPLTDPAAGGAVGGVATFSAITPDTTTIAGTITQFELQNNAATDVITGTVTLIGGGGDIELTSVTYANNETIEVTSLTYTAMV